MFDLGRVADSVDALDALCYNIAHIALSARTYQANVLLYSKSETRSRN